MRTPTPPVALGDQRRGHLNRRSLHLAYATAGYNLAEGLVALAAGTVASSTALIGFGLDSFIEVSSALVVIWQFRSRVPEDRERLALRLIAVSFLALAAWIGVAAVRSLLGPGQAQPSPVGIGMAAASVVVMPALVWAKRRTGRELGSATVVADSTQTLLCTYLSAVLLVGLTFNAWLGWSWADPAAGLVIAAVATREGVHAWRGEQCDDCAIPTVGDPRRGTTPAGMPASTTAAPPRTQTRVCDSRNRQAPNSASTCDDSRLPGSTGR
jgi:divalent metal cation (Fe/Co/Zn/Cd) transporter